MFDKAKIFMPFDKTYISVTTADGHFFTLNEPLTYTALDGAIYTVPAGAVTDGVSAPQFLWDIIPPFGYPWKAAIFHDFLYRGAGLPKAKCDALFYEALISLGVTPLTAKTLYEAVYLYGWRAYSEDRKRR